VTGVAALWAEYQLKRSGMVNIASLEAQLRAKASRDRVGYRKGKKCRGCGIGGASSGREHGRPGAHCIRLVAHHIPAARHGIRRSAEQLGRSADAGATSKKQRLD
jgi:hypothetical protein